MTTTPSTLSPEDLAALVREGEALVRVLSKHVTTQVHDLLPADYSYNHASLDGDGFAVEYNVGFGKLLVLKVPAVGRDVTARLIQTGIGGRQTLTVFGQAKSTPREVVHHLAISPVWGSFAAWRVVVPQ